jgi:hypothetical protein
MTSVREARVCDSEWEIERERSIEWEWEIENERSRETWGNDSVSVCGLGFAWEICEGKICLCYVCFLLVDLINFHSNKNKNKNIGRLFTSEDIMVSCKFVLDNFHYNYRIATAFIFTSDKVKTRCKRLCLCIFHYK